MGLLLTPLCKDLLCAAFPVSGTLNLPTPLSRGLDRKKCHVVPSSWKRSRPSPLPSPVDMPSPPERAANAALGTQQAQPQPWTRPLADYPSPETTQGNPNLFVPWDQATALAPIHALSPSQLGPQAYMQGPIQLSHAQQILECVSQDILVVGNKLDRWWTATDAAHFMADSFKAPGSELTVGGHNAPWFGVADEDTSHPSTDSIFWDADPTVSFTKLPSSDGRGDGAVDGVGMGATPSSITALGVWGYSDKYWDG